MTMPLSGVVVISGLGLAMVNLCTKFDLCKSTRYEDRKGEVRSIKWGGME